MAPGCREGGHREGELRNKKERGNNCHKNFLEKSKENAIMTTFRRLHVVFPELLSNYKKWKLSLLRFPVPLPQLFTLFSFPQGLIPTIVQDAYFRKS